MIKPAQNHLFLFSDWKAFIHPDMLRRDIGKDYGAKFPGGYFEGDIYKLYVNKSNPQQVSIRKSFTWVLNRKPKL